MEKKNVLVTGIGGNVGQGIIRNIRNYSSDIRIIGCNVEDFSAGNHLCDGFYKVPFAYHENYISTINQIILQENIHLIIPSTDYEAYYLSKHIHDVSCTVATSGYETTQIYLDKYLSYQHHKKYGIPFAESYLPSEYKSNLKDIIVKPREGRGSRGIHVNPEHPENFSDEYLIQERHVGKEITTAFYVDKNKQLHGFITMERSLDNGATHQCAVIKDFDEKLETILLKIVQHSDIKGSANLQSIVTESGEIFPFEVNCRISGTNSIRSQFGFNDVKYTLQEYLYEQKPDKPEIIQGIAVRIMMDVIYPNAQSIEELKDNSSNHYIY